MSLSAPAPIHSAQPRSLWPFHDLKDTVYNGQVFSMEQCINLYFICIEVINDLVESFQMYSTHIINHPQSTAEYRSKQAEQALYYEKVVRNINLVLQMDQVALFTRVYLKCHHPGMYQHGDELENDNIRFILQSACGDTDVTDKEKQIIHREFINQRDSRNSHPDSLSRLWNIDDLTDMGSTLLDSAPYL